jgi:hypothetical protein
MVFQSSSSSFFISLKVFFDIFEISYSHFDQALEDSLDFKCLMIIQIISNNITLSFLLVTSFFILFKEISKATTTHFVNSILFLDFGSHVKLGNSIQNSLTS